jgi:endonuclease-3
VSVPTTIIDYYCLENKSGIFDIPEDEDIAVDVRGAARKALLIYLLKSVLPGCPDLWYFKLNYMKNSDTTDRHNLFDRAKFDERRERALKINAVLKGLLPDAKIALKYGNEWELLVAVVLSAQCTDKKVNEVTEMLFRKYTAVDDYAGADPAEFEKDIRQTGFYRNKAKNILSSANIIKEKYKGAIPRTMDEMVALPGVARKTANIVLGNAFGIVEGIAVDTHVRRLSLKMGLTDFTNPDKIEKDLMALLPRSEWFDFTYRFIEYGRRICPARKHDCRDHPLTRVYPPAADIWP